MDTINKFLDKLNNLHLTEPFVLGIILLLLKVSNLITWSWWIVLLPFYFSFAIVAVFLGIMISFFMVLLLFSIITIPLYYLICVIFNIDFDVFDIKSSSDIDNENIK